MCLIQTDKLPYPCDLPQIVSNQYMNREMSNEFGSPLRNVMASVLDHKSNIVLLGKLKTSCDILCLGCVDSIDRVVAQITLRIVFRAQCGIYSRTSLEDWIRISRWELRQPGVDVEVGTYILTDLLVIIGAGVARLSNGLVEDEFACESAVEGIPCRVGGPAIINWCLFS